MRDGRCGVEHQRRAIDGEKRDSGRAGTAEGSKEASIGEMKEGMGWDGGKKRKRKREARRGEAAERRMEEAVAEGRGINKVRLDMVHVLCWGWAEAHVHGSGD
jgi:hypothetical protein